MQTCQHQPGTHQLELAQRVLSRSMAATLTAEAAEAGDTEQASRLWLPAAATTTTPYLTAGRESRGEVAGRGAETYRPAMMGRGRT